MGRLVEGEGAGKVEWWYREGHEDRDGKKK